MEGATNLVANFTVSTLEQLLQLTNSVKFVLQLVVLLDLRELDGSGQVVELGLGKDAVMDVVAGLISKFNRTLVLLVSNSDLSVEHTLEGGGCLTAISLGDISRRQSGELFHVLISLSEIIVEASNLQHLELNQEILVFEKVSENRALALSLFGVGENGVGDISLESLDDT